MRLLLNRGSEVRLLENLFQLGIAVTTRGTKEPIPVPRSSNSINVSVELFQLFVPSFFFLTRHNKMRAPLGDFTILTVDKI